MANAQVETIANSCEKVDRDLISGAGTEVIKKKSWFINIYSYVAIVSIIQFWYGFYLAYSVACLTTLERRYGWPRYDDLKRFFLFKPLTINL